MTDQNFDNRLLKLLEKEVLIEKWKKKSKIMGLVISKNKTKKGSFMLKVKTKKSKYDVVVPIHRKEEFDFAKNVKEGDTIKVIGDKQLSGIIFCDRIKKLNKSSFNEKQVKLSYQKIGVDLGAVQKTIKNDTPLLKVDIKKIFEEIKKR